MCVCDTRSYLYIILSLEVGAGKEGVEGVEGVKYMCKGSEVRQDGIL